MISAYLGVNELKSIRKNILEENDEIIPFTKFTLSSNSESIQETDTSELGKSNQSKFSIH